MVFEYKIVSEDDDVVKCQIYCPEIKIGYDIDFKQEDSVKDIFLVTMGCVNNIILKKEELDKKFDEVVNDGC